MTKAKGCGDSKHEENLEFCGGDKLDKPKIDVDGNQEFSD